MGKGSTVLFEIARDRWDHSVSSIYSVLDSQNHSSLTLSEKAVYLFFVYLFFLLILHSNMNDKNYNYDDPQ